jgi:hypothetical protein
MMLIQTFQEDQQLVFRAQTWTNLIIMVIMEH